MKKDDREITRKSISPIKVYCLPEEKKQIQEQAQKSGLSAGPYLREVGMGYEVKGIVDCQEVLKMVRINGDLGRLGGLLKLWLSGDKRTADISESTIRALLARIAVSMDRLDETMEKVVTPRSK